MSSQEIISGTDPARAAISATTEAYYLANIVTNRLIFAEPGKFRIHLTAHFDSEAPVSVVEDIFGGEVILGRYEQSDPNLTATLVLRRDDVILHFNRHGPTTWNLTLYGSSQEDLRAWLDKIRSVTPDIAPGDDREILIGFWALDAEGNPRREPRRIMGEVWGEIEENYPPPVRAKLDDLIKLDTPESGGKLLLAHGVAGCGKTTWIRALAHAWKDWCTIDYVIDPEAYFQHSFYMLSSFREIEDDKWKLLIVEDAGEYLRHDAKMQTGQGLSRLLNLTDGLLGQGLKLLVLMTTNEEMKEIHPAVHRPGRCLFTTEFDPFTRSEATHWLTKHVGPEGMKLVKIKDEMTLAEMYEQAGGARRIAKEKDDYNPAGYA